MKHALYQLNRQRSTANPFFYSLLTHKTNCVKILSLSLWNEKISAPNFQ